MSDQTRNRIGAASKNSGASKKNVNKRHCSKKKRIVVTMSVLVLAISVILYSLAYRYLIERAETPIAIYTDPSVAVTTTIDTSTKNNISTEGTTTSVASKTNKSTISNSSTKSTTNRNNATAKASASTTNTSTSKKAVTTTSMAGTSTASVAKATSTTKDNYTADDWNYESSTLKVSINKVTTGEGDDKITYFVADVKLKSTTSLHTAFAKNTFGRNIVETTSGIAQDNGAVFAINGDYYGFRGDGILIRNGSIYRDTAARTAAAIYKDGTMKTFEETSTTAQALIKSGVIDTFSFGPALLNNGTAITNFDNVVVDTNFGNRSIQDANPRTGIGLIGANHYVFVVVDGRSSGYSRGMTLTEFAKVFDGLGCTEAYNLDGGGSSTMYFMGRVVNNPLGRNEERAISDIIYVK